MVVFSPDSSDEDSLNFIKAKLRKRQTKVVDEDSSKDEDVNDSCSSDEQMMVDNDKENKGSDSSEDDDLANEKDKKKSVELKDCWSDDDSIPDEALEAALAAAQSVQAKWRVNAETTATYTSLREASTMPEPISHTPNRGTGVESQLPCQQDMDHPIKRTPGQLSTRQQEEDSSEISSSGDSSSSDDESLKADSITVLQDVAVAGETSTKADLSRHFQVNDNHSEQDITPFGSPEQPVKSVRDEIPTAMDHLPENESATDAQVPIGDPRCICEYDSEGDWSFSELENKDRPPEKNEELDPFGYPMDESEATNPCHAKPEEKTSIVEKSSLASKSVKAPATMTEETQPMEFSPASDRVPEIDPSLYVPKPPVVFEPPIVHEFNLRTRPLSRRSTVSIHSVFQSPITRLWYSKFDSFNQMQSEMANMLANSDDNVVVSAPTGAGKTAVFEMAMARFFATDLEIGGVSQISRKRKIIYVSPSKALCEERYDDWSRRLQGMNLGIQIAVITGDGDPAESFHDLATSHFILTTPEKWDSLTRRWTENFFLFASVKLFLIDEVHMIADESRGCCLEAIIMRMKTIHKASQNVRVSQAELASSSYSNTSPEAINSVLRMVAVSATLPNIAEIAMFLEANEAHSFDQSYRPVPLTTHVVSTGKIGKNEFLFGKNLCESVPNTIVRFSDQKPTIVFCHSKNDTEKLADILARSNLIGIDNSALSNIASQTRLRKLQMAMMRGTAYHHAGLDVADRRLVEKGFLDGKIRVLCATSTLAMGVNLPAHLVVIMGTRAWRGKAGYQDLDQASLLQMIGRAGRPGFDTTGTAVILTDLDSKHKFENMAARGLPSAMSQCVGEKLVETLNAEVSQRVITSAETAANWFMNTLFFIQDSRNVQSAEEIEQRITEKCHTALNQLKAIGVVALSSNQDVFPLAASHIMSSNLVGLDAFKAITSLPFDASLCQLLKAISNIEDLQRPLRRSEKKPLNAAQKSVKYHLEGAPSQVRVKENWEKAFVLLQVHISRLQLDCNNPTLEFTLRNETASMVDFASRMLAAIEEYSYKGSKNGHVVFQSLRLRRALALNMWGPQDGVLGQIKGVSKEIVGKLRMSGITSFVDVISKRPEEIESAACRQPPFGTDLQTACRSLLDATLKIEAKVSTAEGSVTPSDVVCILTARAASDRTKSLPKRSDVKYSLIIYTDLPGGCLLYKENIAESGEYQVLLPPKYGKLSIRLVASICGLDDMFEHEGNIPIAGSKAAQAGTLDEIRKASDRIRNPAAKRKGLTQSTIGKKRRNTDTTYGKKPVTARHQTSSTLSQKVEQHQTVTHRPKSDKHSKLTAPTSIITPSPKAHSLMLSPLSTIGERNSKIDVTIGEPPRQSPNSDELSKLLQKQYRTGSNRVVETVHQSMPNVGRNTDSFSSQASFSRLSANESSPCPPVRSQGWKKARMHQEKQQQRAFVRKKDNPFTLYTHDPNNSESFLDELSTQNRSQDTSSIIPAHATRISNRSPFRLPSSQTSSWNKSTKFTASQRRKPRTFLNNDATFTPSHSQRQERQLSSQQFERSSFFGSSGQTIVSQPHCYTQSGHLPATSPCPSGNRYEPSFSGDHGYGYPRDRLMAGFNRQSHDRLPRQITQLGGYNDPIQEQSHFYHRPLHGSYAVSHQVPFEGTYQAPIYGETTEVPFNRSYQMVDPRHVQANEMAFMRVPTSYQPMASNAAYRYTQPDYPQQMHGPDAMEFHDCPLPDFENVQTQNTTIQRYGVNDCDLANDLF